MTFFKKQFYPIFIYGVLSVTVQLSFIKIISFVFSGNEISISIVLGHWLIFTALGSYTYGKYQHKISFNPFIIALLYIVFSILFYWLLYYLRQIIGIDNFVILSNDTVFFVSLLFLALPVFINGFMFPAITASIFEQYTKVRINHIYGCELIGAALGSLLFALCLKYTGSTYEYFIVVAILAVPGFSILLHKKRYPLLSAILIIFLGITLLLEDKLSKIYYEKFQLTSKVETPTGIITELQHKKDKTLYVDNIFIHSNENLSVNEEIVHFACSIHRSPENLLIIGPTNPLMLREIAKYKTIERVTHISSNEDMHKKVFAQHPDFDFSFTLNHIFSDPYKKIKSINENFDVILLNIPEPTNLKFNRYYTTEFLQILSRIMTPNSLVDLRINGSETFLPPDRAKLLNTIKNTVKKTFSEILVIPGGTIHFIGTNNYKYYDIADFSVIPDTTHYINSYYLSDRLTLFKTDFLNNNLEKNPTEEINSLFKPTGYFYSALLQDLQTKGFISKIYRKLSKIPVFALYLFIIIITLPVFFIRNTKKRSKFNMIFFGFFVMSQESILILLYQSIAGSVYLRTALIIFLFMTGAGISSLLYNKFSLKLKHIFLLANLVNLTAISIIFFNQLVFIINVSILVTGFISGQVFPLLMKQYKKNELIAGTGKMYAYDILGGSVGLYLISIIIIPVWGFLPALISIEIMLLFLSIHNIIRNT
ncbi:MAG: hypothetical protein ACLFQM_00075 [Fidelibacterota bacterium]